MVMRQPLFPDSSRQAVHHAEKSHETHGSFSARGRRAQFAKTVEQNKVSKPLAATAPVTVTPISVTLASATPITITPVSSAAVAAAPASTGQSNRCSSEHELKNVNKSAATKLKSGKQHVSCLTNI